MADNGWNVVSIGDHPAAQQAAPQPASAPGGDAGGWNVVSVGDHPSVPQPAPPQPAPGAGPHEDAVDNYLKNAAWWNPVAGAANLMAGVGAGVEQSAAGLAKIGRHVVGGEMTKPEQWLQEAAAKPTEGKAQAFGKGGEAIGEFFTGEEALSLLGRAGSALTGANKLKQASQIADLANKVPMIGKLLRIGMESVKAGALGGAQEYAKTGGDTGQAAISGGITGALTAGMGGAGMAGRALLDLAPGERVMEGAVIPYLKSQINKAGRFIEGGDISELNADMAAKQQTAAHQVISNVASRTTNKVLEGINATRKYFSGTEDPARLLPAPQGSKPFTFDLGGAGAAPATEEQTGTLMQRAARTEGGGFSAQSATGEDLAQQEAAQSALDQETLDRIGMKKALRKPLTPEEKQAYDEAWARESAGKATTEPRADVRTSGGTMMRQTKNPGEAVSHLRDLADQMSSPEFANLPEADQRSITEAHQTLSDQLNMYHSSPYRNNFAPVDIDSITPHIRNWGHAADAIKATVKPIWDKINKLSDGAMTAAQQEVEDATAAVKNARSGDAFNAATERLSKATQSIDELMDAHGTGVSIGERAVARQGWSQAKKLQTLHAVFEHMMNGVTTEETDQGLSKVMTGNARSLQAWLDNPQNSKMLDDLIGQDSRTNLKELTLLLSKVTPQRHTGEAALNIAKLLDPAKYKWAGGILGSGIGSYFGLAGSSAGVAPGIAAGMAVRQVLRIAATNPTVGKMLTFAVDHGIRPGVYAPLIARTIVESGRPLLGGSETEQPKQPMQLPPGAE